jgi:hypothetical protein
MSNNLKLSRGWTYNNVTQNDDENFDNLDLDISESRPALTAGGLEEEVVKAIDVRQLKALFIKADQDVTIKVNDPDVPVGPVIALKAGRALQWSAGCGMACPFGVDVTALYVSNNAAAAPNLFIGVAFDPTPSSSGSSSSG